jgi:hypothetical protein
LTYCNNETTFSEKAVIGVWQVDFFHFVACQPDVEDVVLPVVVLAVVPVVVDADDVVTGVVVVVEIPSIKNCRANLANGLKMLV